MASPSTPSSRAVSGIRNTDETCWNSVGTGREVCCTHGTRGSSFPYLAMRTLGHLMFPFAHSPSASGGWTVRWCGVLRRGEGVVSCVEDVVVGWLHAPCIERSDTHPPRWHPGSPGERRRSLCCLPTKGILVWLQRVFPSGLPPRGGGLGGPRSHARVPPCPSKQASNGQGGTRGGTVLSDSVHAANPPGRPPVRVLNIRLPTILDALPARPRPSRGSPDGCYLVDPASSHMLVSKIKPCMCKYELIQTVKLRMAH